jgi:hypothetical protein
MISRIPYKVFVYIAYGFYILIGLIWFALSFVYTGHFDYIAFSIIAVFSVQAYFRHKLTNLILGILTLFFSIFMLLQAVYEARHNHFNTMSVVFVSTWAFSLIMSGILIFSYLRLSFKD